MDERNLFAAVYGIAELNRDGFTFNINDNESGKFYFDATEIFSNKDAAIEAGRRNGQIAIFDLNTLNEIRL